MVKNIPISEIEVGERVRQLVKEDSMEELAQSIEANGLLQPIVLTEGRKLVAGFRRLEATKRLGHDSIAATIIPDISDAEIQLRLELEENVRREDFTWQEINAAVTTYHEEFSSSAEETASALLLSPTAVFRHLVVRSQYDAVKDFPMFTTAYNQASRNAARRRDVEMATIGHSAPEPPPSAAAAGVEPAPAPTANGIELYNANFIQWAESYSGPPFNLIHCDFPYGAGVGDRGATGQKPGNAAWGYEDTDVIFQSLLQAFQEHTQKLAGDSCHLVFWFPMARYEMLKKELSANGWRVFHRPLIWTKGHSGLATDAARRFRNVYETALFATRTAGDRKIVSTRGDSYGFAPMNENHPNEKPAAVLRHFFRALVDETTRILDPTAGSALALAVAKELGAQLAVGVELNEDWAKAAAGRLQCPLL